MGKQAFNLVILAIVLVLLQALVLNHICLWNVAVPIVFFYLLLRLPVSLPQGWMLTIGFFLGLIIDALSDTYGLNALCCTMLAGLRPPLLRLYVTRPDEISTGEPTIATIGLPTYLKYLVTATLFYCILYFLIESMTVFIPWLVLARIVCSTLLSALIMVGIDLLADLGK